MRKHILALLLVFTLLLGMAFPASAGSYASQIQSVSSSFTRQNISADNIYQQICNGTYRTTEFLNIIAYILDD